jgi:hypothetical protein
VDKKNAVDSRIAAVIARRSGASSTEQFPVTIAEGTEVQRPRAGAGQIESSVHMSTWKEVNAPAKVIKPADERHFRREVHERRKHAARSSTRR